MLVGAPLIPEALDVHHENRAVHGLPRLLHLISPPDHASNDPPLISVVSLTALGLRLIVCSAIGVFCGQVMWTVAASAGISALLVASEPAFLAVKYAGAAYLLFLGLQAGTSGTPRWRCSSPGWPVTPWPSPGWEACCGAPGSAAHSTL
ncbi:MAG TPA: LysE family transporter [Streptosporangiaceae bacterium]